mmetsp:Transcript_21405/g.53067  ORF Transcript_21405/g.53067 Transcript_21405/m.53067 type:complete len:94 (-) Transcript_21405:238-519(-)
MTSPNRTTSGSPPLTEEKDNTMAMFIMAGVVASSAGFAMYTRQADSLLRRMNSASKIQGMAKASTIQGKPNRAAKFDGLKAKGKTFHEKDDFF